MIPHDHRSPRPRKSIALLVVAIVVVAGVLSFAAYYLTRPSARPADYSTPIQNMVTSSWNAYVSSQGYHASQGGVALYITSSSAAYFGAANISGATPDTHFRAASNTKSFTSAAIMLLYQEGKLNISNTITSDIPGTTTPYVPNTPGFAIPYKSQITIAELLGHRAGVFDVSNSVIPANASCPYANDSYIDNIEQKDPSHQFTFAELVGVDAQCQISYFPPGTGYHYSNTGYSLLGQIIEDVSGISYGQFIEQNFLLPNGLSNTSVPSSANDTTLPSPYAPGYIFNNGTVLNVTQENISPHVAEGNIISTPRDLSTWIRSLISGRAGVQGNALALMTHDCTTSITNLTSWSNSCFGLISLPGGLWGHNGANQGYLSYMLFDPEHNVTVVVFTNIWLIDSPGGIPGELSGLLLPIARQAMAIIGDPGPNEGPG